MNQQINTLQQQFNTQINKNRYPCIWGVNLGDQIWFREGVSVANPSGNSWTQICGCLKYQLVPKV
jgi:hypothetical protein